jgi:hypothetical protein
MGTFTDIDIEHFGRGPFANITETKPDRRFLASLLMWCLLGMAGAACTLAIGFRMGQTWQARQDQSMLVATGVNMSDLMRSSVDAQQRTAAALERMAPIGH